jgi:lantibiotic modifying enzyme
MWQAITGAETSRECWSTIAEIERSLIDYTARSSAEQGQWTDPGIAGGDAGVALFFSYLHAAVGSAGAADRALEALDRSMSALPERRLLPSLYSGFFGVGWTVTHLTREMFEGDSGLASEIDDALRQLLSETKETSPFELVAGLAGYGTYLVERLPDPGAAELLGRIIDVLEASRDASGAWYTDPSWLPDWQRELMPRGCYNLGVAHGIPGVIGLLASAWREGFDDPRIPKLAEDAVRWLLTQKHLSMPGSVLPSHVAPDDEPRPTRTAWCYGDLGAATVILSAAESFGRSDWREEALSIARIAAGRSFEETKTMDSGLCHGASGIAHLFNRIYQATGEEEMRDTALAWYRRALDMRRPGEGMAGYLNWVVIPPHEGVWKAEAGFLTGVAGVGLALLAAVTVVEPAWDRVMLVAVPPRNGESAR